MNVRELLGELEANCPICGSLLSRDPDGSVICEHCLNNAREKNDYSIMSTFYRKLDVEVWILDKKKIDRKDEGAKDE